MCFDSFFQFLCLYNDCFSHDNHITTLSVLVLIHPLKKFYLNKSKLILGLGEFIYIYIFKGMYIRLLRIEKYYA